MALLFISHSSKDNEIVKRYKKKIEEFGFQSIFLDFDEKDGIQINEAWEERLYKELIKSNIALCLVSKNWIESCWCQKEYSLAKTLNKETILVSIEEDPQHKKEVFQWIGEHLQQIDIADNPEAFEKVLKHIDELTRKVFDKPYAWDENKNPYPGLLPFTEEMAAVFYGREDETDAIITDLNNPKSLASVHALLIVGASGMGKSSLLQAGILPKLKTFEEYRKKWHILPAFRPGKDPLGKLLRLLVSEAFSDSEEARDFYEHLKEEIRNNCFEASIEKLFDRILLKYPDKKILLPIDQAEEFFTVSDKEEKELFFKLLSWIFEHRDTFYTIWTIRSDQIEKFQTDASLEIVRKYHATHLLTPIKEEHISTIIKYPAYKSDIVLEESLIERMRQDLKDTKALPLLAYTLNELTKGFFEGDTRHKARVVTLKEYLALAKEGENPIYAIVERKIEALLLEPKRIDASLDKEKLLEETKRLFLYHLIDIDIDGKPSKKIVIKEELNPLMCKIADAFVQERLLVSGSVQVSDGSDTTVPTYEIAHESIIHNWPKLQSWINEEKEFFIVRAQVRVAMKEWQKADESKKADALLGGLLLEKAQKFLDKAWSETEKRYIQKSIDQAQKIDKRKRNFLIGSFTTISALAGFGYYEFFQARENAKEAEKKKLLALAEAKRANRNERKMKEELERAEHNLGLVLLEKANVALEKEEIEKANLFVYASLLKIKEKYDKNNAKARAKSIIMNYEDRAISSLNHKAIVFSVAYSPDGKNIVSGSYNKPVKIWDAKNFKEISILEAYAIWSLSYSPDGKRIVTGSLLHEAIKVWNAKNFKEITTLKGEKNINDIRSVTFSPDSKRIISGSDAIRIWDAKSFDIISIFEKHKWDIYSIAYSPDGKRIISGSYDRTIKIWDSKNFKVIAVLKGHKREVKAVSYLSDGKIIASGSGDKTIKIWDTKSFKEIITLKGHKDDIWSIDCSPDGKTIISGSGDKTIKIWDTKSFKEIITLKGHKDSVYSVKYSPDGKTIISSSKDKTIKLWITNNNIREIISLKRHNSFVTSVAYSSDGKLIASGSYDKTIKICDAKSFKEIATLKGHKDGINSVAYSPDGKIIASGSDDMTIRIWDANSFKEIASLKGHKYDVKTVAFSPDGKQIVSGSLDTTIKIWNAVSFKEITTLQGHENTVLSVAYSPDGKQIVSGSYDKTIKIWDAVSFKELATIKGHKKVVNSVAYSPDGKIIVSGSDDMTIRIWDANSFKEIASLKGHKYHVKTVAFSPDNKILISSSDTIKIWDAHNFREIATLESFKYYSDSITFSPNNKTFLFTSQDKTIRIWDLQELVNLDNPKYIKQNIKRLEQFLQVKLDGITLKDATIPPLSTKESYLKHHPFYWIDDAKNGDAQAMYQLGIIYDRGNENNKALEWYKKALKAGYKPAKERISFLEKWMAEHPEKSNNS